MNILGVCPFYLQVNLWDLDPGPFRTNHTEVKCMQNCTAAIGEPVRLQIMTKDAFETPRRKSCVKEEPQDSCSLNATLVIHSLNGTKSDISTNAGQTG